MNITQGELDGLLILEPQVFGDIRPGDTIMKILIFGSEGQLGFELVRQARNLTATIKATGIFRAGLPADCKMLWDTPETLEAKPGGNH
jgi:hypothetical protein